MLASTARGRDFGPLRLSLEANHDPEAGPIYLTCAMVRISSYFDEANL